MIFFFEDVWKIEKKKYKSNGKLTFCQNKKTKHFFFHKPANFLYIYIYTHTHTHTLSDLFNRSYYN